ncbi:MAG: TolC family protein [Deltaproteobacteria bacterium]|nr:TolC family protein [Deltaproteobacteria bacterium]
MVHLGTLLFRFQLIIFMVFFCAGCGLERHYTYDQIKGEFAHPTKSSQPQQSNQPGDPSILSGTVSLSEAIEIGVANNPEIEMAVARIRQSEAIISESLASFRPVVTAYGEYMQGDAPSAYLFRSIDQRKLPAGADFNNPGWFENYEVGIHARMNLFNGGRDLLRKRMAETGQKINELDRQSVENALIASVIHAYYTVLAARDYIAIAQESVSTVATQLRIMEAQYRAGGALKSDVLSLEVRLAQAREDLVKAENNASLSIAALANLLGLDADTPLQLAKEQDVSLDLPGDYQGGLVHALANRAELQKVRLHIIESRMSLDMASSEYLPRLDAHYKYYHDDPQPHFEGSRKNWTAGIILNWDFFTGFSTQAKVDRAENVLAEMIASDRKTTQSIQLDLKTTYLKLAEAKARLAVAEASVAQATESLRLVKKEYEGGSATIVRYLNAELARNMAQIHVTEAYYDQKKAEAAVGRALGYWGATYAQEGLTQNE